MSSNENIISGFDDSHDKNLRLILDVIQTVPRCISVYVTGSIDNYNSTFFQEKMSKILEAGFVNVVLKKDQIKDWDQIKTRLVLDLNELIEKIQIFEIGLNDKAIEIIKSESGTKFDPELVDIFVSIPKEEILACDPKI